MNNATYPRKPDLLSQVRDKLLRHLWFQVFRRRLTAGQINGRSNRKRNLLNEVAYEVIHEIH
ncbi:hypothetical protein D1AOALGA4SA_2068 [Olavius algarvensis Delta 1 endosymbiont]|nr:hypothetical protein D1AOALGA4SA_2068 [Olavius algarvensis Delta 1 endosymbiont]